jgi:hypothetical protein
MFRCPHDCGGIIGGGGGGTGIPGIELNGTHWLDPSKNARSDWDK